MNEIEKVLKALANRRRIATIVYLSKSPGTSVGNIAHKIKLSFRSTSRHLAVLSYAGLVEKRQSGLTMFYSLTKRGRSAVRVLQSISKSL